MFLTLVALGLVAPAATRAQDSSQAYCQQLSEMYRRYVQNAGGQGSSGRGRIDVEGEMALDDCGKGKAAASISVLEKRLRDNKITPPGGGEFKP